MIVKDLKDFAISLDFVNISQYYIYKNINLFL